MSRRDRILARYARVLIAAHDRGEITAEEVFHRGMAAGTRILARYGPPPQCGAYYGVGDGTAATCIREPGHPEVSQDGIGHADATRLRNL